MYVMSQAQAESGEVAQQLLHMGGQLYIANINDAEANNAATNKDQFVGMREAFVQIRLPWCGTKQKIPLDSTQPPST